MHSIEVRLKEYEALRHEILTAMNNRNTILSFGLATIGAIFTGGLVAHKTSPDPILTSFAFILAIPIVTCFVMLMWAGEHERIQRAGKYLFELEEIIKKESKKDLLNWEHYLRKNRLKLRYPYFAAVFLLLLISIISQLLGLFIADFAEIWSILAIIFLFFHVFICIYIIDKIFKLRSYILEGKKNN